MSTDGITTSMITITRKIESLPRIYLIITCRTKTIITINNRDLIRTEDKIDIDTIKTMRTNTYPSIKTDILIQLKMMTPTFRVFPKIKICPEWRTIQI